ncbi:P-loop NTPase fold protein [Pseudomonas poae]|uniref:KAP family P-loop NTPase fold protein n=1 Tax=Pseudomonas poae TaxID=200451 RepID=UPI0030CD9FFB
MKLKNTYLEIPEDDIFLNDRLKRKKSVDNLGGLLEKVSSPLVFSVNAPWGAGKTTFMRMLHSSLAISEAKSIYFSAWETDFAVDPLLAFIGEMNAGLSIYIDGDREKSKAWAKAKAAGTHLMRRSIPVGVKLATAGLLDMDKIIEDETSKLTEALAKDVIDAYSKNKQAISIFKENVAKVLKGEDGALGRMYIFVDELDRCRPTYAIELLERIKHLLDIEGLVFILALDKQQLAHSVRAVYGADFDAVGYLKRFIDVEFTLPSADTNSFVDDLLAKFELDKYFASRKAGDTIHDKDSLLGMLRTVTHRMSLRNIEQLVAKVKLVSLAVKVNQYFYPEFVIFLLVVKEKYNDIYMEFSQEKSNGADLTTLLVEVIPGDELLWTRQYLAGVIISGKMRAARSWSEDRIKALKEIYNSPQATEHQKNDAGRILDVVDQTTKMGRGVPLQQILERIDMLSDFEFN